MQRFKVLVTDIAWSTTDVEAAVLDRVGADIVYAETGQEAELLREVGNASAILTCFAQVSERTIHAGTQLKVVSRYGIGVDNIAVDAATRRGIPVTNVPDYCLTEVAEHVLTLMLALARDLRYYDQAVRRDAWGLHQGRPVHRLAGQILGIVGFGRIGQHLARTATALGLRAYASDPVVAAEAIRSAGAEPVPLDRLLEQADFVSLHTPLTDATTGLIGERELRLMRPTAFIINASRGAVLDQGALTRALQQRRIAGAALDVFVPEQLPVDHPLLALDNVILTPHVAFYSEESLAELARRAAENVATVLAGERPATVVNPEVFATS